MFQFGHTLMSYHNELSITVVLTQEKIHITLLRLKKIQAILHKHAFVHTMSNYFCLFISSICSSEEKNGGQHQDARIVAVTKRNTSG